MLSVLPNVVSVIAFLAVLHGLHGRSISDVSPFGFVLPALASLAVLYVAQVLIARWQPDQRPQS